MIKVSITDKTKLTDSICRVRLCALDGSALPSATPGAHIDVHLPNGIIRQYSLCNELCNEASVNEYEIAVLNEPEGRGGSKYVHEELKVGDSLSISEPKNLFQLDDGAQKSLLFAAGVGITPILSMAEQLARANADFTLHYCSKSPEQTAYLSRIQSSAVNEKTQFHFSQDARINLVEAIKHADDGTHLYVCGPVSFINDVIDTATNKGWKASNIHREYFTVEEIDTSNDGSFEIEIKSTGEVFKVDADATMLDVLEDNGYMIPVSCEQGVCGTCITGLLSGTADHRDVFMTADEHSKMDQITPCCSRACSNRLVLDL